MGLKLNGKILFYWGLFFILTYFESYDVGGISFASVWKIPFIAYWSYYTYLGHSSDHRKAAFIGVGGLFCLLFVFHSNMLTSVMPEITDITKFIVIPSMFYFIITKFKRTPYAILENLYWLSIFLIWTNVPYLIGLIKPKVQMDYTQSFGEGMAADAGFSGPYMTIHTQSVLMASSLILISFLMYNYRRKFKTSNIFLWLTISLALYCLYLSFARTGWLLFCVGMFFVFVKRVSFKSFKKAIPFLVIGLLAFGYMFVNNSSFRQRLLDEREYSSGSKSDDIGSGRLLMSSLALQNWVESTPYEIFKGYGLEKGRDKMKDKMGVRLFAHNGFIDILQRSGLIGLGIFIFFIVKMYRTFKHTKGPSQSLCKAFFWGWILVGATQEFTIIYLNVFLASVLAFNYLSGKVVQDKLKQKKRLLKRHDQQLNLSLNSVS